MIPIPQARLQAQSSAQWDGVTHRTLPGKHNVYVLSANDLQAARLPAPLGGPQLEPGHGLSARPGSGILMCRKTAAFKVETWISKG